MRERDRRRERKKETQTGRQGASKGGRGEKHPFSWSGIPLDYYH